MRALWVFFTCFWILLEGSEPSLRILHLTFHKGCAREIEDVAASLSLEVETWFIPDLPREMWDGETLNRCSLYNMGHARAERIWKQLESRFDQFDLILTSDTAPLARIFLQNGWKKPLIIWICNRFDYVDRASLDCDFPDPEFYELFQRACHQDHVRVVAYTPFEHHHASLLGIETGGCTITPCAPCIRPDGTPPVDSFISRHVDRAGVFFLPPYHNETKFMDLSVHLASLGIPNYCGRYAGPYDLVGFRGIIHLPYNWSNLALFENMRLGIPYFVPSRAFFRELAAQGNYFHAELGQLLQEDLFDLSEWYSQEREGVITYFDSWEDLQRKIAVCDSPALQREIRTRAEIYREEMLQRWKKVFFSNQMD